MRADAKQVRPIRQATKAQVSGALAAGWARVSAGRKGAFADNLDIHTKTVDRAITGETLPELHTVLNSLADDPTALDEIFALYGLTVVAREASSGADMELLGQLGHTLAEYIDRMRDGRRCHKDTLAMAVLFRPLIPRMAAIVDQADALTGARA